MLNYAVQIVGHMWKITKGSYNLFVFLVLVLTIWVNTRQLSKLKDSSEYDEISFEYPKKRITTVVDDSMYQTLLDQNEETISPGLIQADDFIYADPEFFWDASPIVIEPQEHRKGLVFFTTPKVGCTVFKQLFRRMIYEVDWKTQSDYNDNKLLPHHPKFNGLTYLHDYTMEQANEIILSPNYTKAIFVRDPKERLLSAFLDKAISNNGIHVRKKCCPEGECVESAQTLDGFLDLIEWCQNSHWDAQSNRMESKFWKYIDFVGHIERASNDAKKLLQHIGAWDEFGKNGWGTYGNQSIFESSEDAGSHATWAKWRMWQWYTPELERRVEKFFADDYAHPMLNLTLTRLYNETDQ